MMGSLQVEETSAYCTVNHWASASNYQLSNIKRPARDSNRRPQRLEARTLTATPPSPQITLINGNLINFGRTSHSTHFVGQMVFSGIGETTDLIDVFNAMSSPKCW